MEVNPCETQSEPEAARTVNCCGKKLSRRSCCCAVCWASVLVVILLVVLGLYLLGPAIARGSLDRATIRFTRLTISEPGTTSFKTSADLTISDVGPVPCTIGEMKLSVLYEDRQVGVMTMPSMSVEPFTDNHRTVDDATFQITDMKNWNAFSTAMLRNKSLIWRLKSSADLTAKALGMGVTFRGIAFDKKIPLTTFDGLDDVQMDVFDMSKSTKSHVYVSMTVCMNNPSDVAITEMGELYFGMYYKGAYMGNVTASKSSIKVTRQDPSSGNCTRFGKKGYNSLEMTGGLQPADHHFADELISQYLGGRTSAVTAKALSPIAVSMPIFNAGMQGLELNTALNGDENPLISGLDMLSVMMKPVDDKSVSMQMNANVHVSPPLGPSVSLQLFSVNMALNMSYNDRIIGRATTGNTTVPAPNTIIGKGTVKVPASVSMSLPDKGAQLTTLAKDLIAKNQLSLSINGESNCLAQCSALGYQMHIAGVPVKLPNPVAKPPLSPVVVTGMGGLPGVVIKSHQIPGIVPDGTGGCKSLCGVKINFVAMVQNPSPFGLEIGTLNANVLTQDGVVLGSVRTTDTGLVLSPGSNQITMAGRLLPAAKDLGAAAAFFSTYMQKKTQPAKVLGIDAGPSKIKWLNDAVHGLSLGASFPGAEDSFSALSDISSETMGMTIKSDGTPTMSGTIKAKMHTPQAVDISIIRDMDGASMAFDLIDVQSGQTVGSLKTRSKIQYNDGSITATFDTTPVSVKNSDAFAQLVKDLVVSKTKRVKMVGTASPHALSNMGWMQLKDVPFAGETDLYGFNLFKDPNSGQSLMKILRLDVVGGESGILNLVTDCEVTNPSNVAASLGPITLELFSENRKIAELTIDNFSLQGNKERNAVTKFTNVKVKYNVAEAGEVGRRFLSTFALGQAQQVSARGTMDSSHFALLKPAMQALTTETTLPGLVDNRLLSRGVMFIPDLLRPDLLYDLPTVLVVRNPFAAVAKFQTAHCDVTSCKKLDHENKVCREYWDYPNGYYTPDRVDEDVGGKAEKALQKHSVKLYSLFTLSTLETFVKSAASGTYIRLNGSMDLSFGDTVVSVDYAERDVPVCLEYFGHRCLQDDVFTDIHTFQMPRNAIEIVV